MITQFETSIAKELFMEMFTRIKKNDGTADGNKIVGIIATMLASAAVTVRDESMMSETIDEIAKQAKVFADLAPSQW